MKNLKKLGTALNKQEQKAINGGISGCQSYERCQSRCQRWGGNCQELIGTGCYFCLGGGPF